MDQARQPPMDQPRPSSLVVMIGPPRSGTTLIANTFMSHSKVAGLIEPWHRRRDEDYATTDPARLMAENGLTPSPGQPHLAIKETTTRGVNVDLSLKLLQTAADQGIYPALIVILRCPFAAFLSQVEASRQMWREQKLTEASQDTLGRWVNAQSRALKKITDHARAQHFRLISYEAFCAHPASEMARLMALIPERLEADQMQLRPPAGMAAGDPKTRAKAGRIELTDRSPAIAELIETVGPGKPLDFCQQLRKIVLDHVCHEPDAVTLDRLSRLVA